MIDKTKFAPCSMPCTEQQWQELKPYLDKYGVIYKDIDSFKKHPIIANNLSDKAYTISNVLSEARNMNNRTYNPEFSIPFFLKNCGVIDFQEEQPKEEEKPEKKITALVHYEEFLDSGHPLLDGTWVTRSKVVEVLKLTELNDMFERITKIDILPINA